MRQLFIPACICLAAWSGPAGTEVTPPAGASAFAPIDHFKFTGERPQPATDGSGHHPVLSHVSSKAVVAALEQPKTEETPTPADTAASAKPDSASKTESPDQKLAALTPADTDAVKRPVDTAKSTVDVKPETEEPRQKVEAPMPPAPKPVVHRSTREICDTLAKAAHTNDVPVPFFIRLLFQESRFKPAVVSEAGAQGIAQFMPHTAASVGLDNPFDPLQAIPAAARLLHSLIDDFGNLGLAAAAYNAGPTRIRNWLNKKGHLPDETRGYVKAITGRPAETWKVAASGHSVTRLPDSAPCKDVAGLYAWYDGKKVPLPPPAPVVHRDIVVAKDDGTHKAPSKDAKAAKADTTNESAKTASRKSAAQANKVAAAKSTAHGSRAAEQAQKDKDAIQLAARKHRHKARSRKRAKPAHQ